MSALARAKVGKSCAGTIAGSGGGSGIAGLGGAAGVGGDGLAAGPAGGSVAVGAGVLSGNGVLAAGGEGVTAPALVAAALFVGPGDAGAGDEGAGALGVVPLDAVALGAEVVGAAPAGLVAVAELLLVGVPPTRTIGEAAPLGVPCARGDAAAPGAWSGMGVALLTSGAAPTVATAGLSGPAIRVTSASTTARRVNRIIGWCSVPTQDLVGRSIRARAKRRGTHAGG